VASPIPLEPPVIRAVFPSKLIAVSPGDYCG
jgi:hypothetical protein